MFMTKTKWWLDSSTIKGIIATTIAFVVLILKMFGVEIIPGEQADITNILGEIIVSAIGFYGIVRSIIGRVDATEPLRLGRYQ